MALGGATTSFGEGGMRTSVTPISADDQLGGLEGPYDINDIWSRVDTLRKTKYQQEMERMRLAHEMELERMAEEAKLRAYMTGGGGGGGGGAAYPRTAPRTSAPSATGNIRDMFQVKQILDSMPYISTRGITGSEAWRNMPAAAAMTGVNLPRSGFELYADIAKAGGLAGSDPYSTLGTNVHPRTTPGMSY